MSQLRQVVRPSTPAAERQTTARSAGSRQQGRARVVCRGCGAFVADAAAKTEVNGAHAHTFINPMGLIFRVGCFTQAPGARPIGDESEDWTWFAGFAWQAVLCASCYEHLGWCYRNASAAFVALILDKVDERGD